jgi:hypothetical protein
MFNDYELCIISKDDQSKDKVLKKYNVDEIDTIGVFENEAFELLFKNNTYTRIQVKLSIDGTDILTGKLADTNETGEMWIVEPNSSIKLKAWPETNKNGSQFVFSNTENSVAYNTHGVMSGKGFIAAAVFIEGQPLYIDVIGPTGFRGGSTPFGTSTKWAQPAVYYNNLDSSFSSNSSPETKSAITSCSLDNYSAPGVGAGETIQQTITKVAGLNQPKFQKIISIRYDWWTKLRSTLRQISSHPAFPGNKEEKMIDLGKTPKIKKNNNKSQKRRYIEYERFV